MIWARAGRNKHEFRVEMRCGPYSFTTAYEREWKTSPKKGKPKFSGNCDWKTPFQEIQMELPASHQEIPDLFVYLFRGDTPLSFKRFTAADLIEGTSTGKPSWVQLGEDTALNRLGAEVFPGSLLMFIDMGTPAGLLQSPKPSPTASAVVKVPHKVTVHVHQARNLAAADKSTGALDPYIKVIFNGECMQTFKKKATRFPQFGQSFEFECEFGRIEYAPEVVLQLWDHDRFGSDDYVGQTRVKITAAPWPLPCGWPLPGNAHGAGVNNTLEKEPGPWPFSHQPESGPIWPDDYWRTLAYQTDGMDLGELLVSIEVRDLELEEMGGHSEVLKAALLNQPAPYEGHIRALPPAAFLA